MKAKTARVFFILNKADSLAPDEQGAAIEFLHKVLGEHELIGTTEPIFCISARRGLLAKREGNNEILEASGQKFAIDRPGIGAREFCEKSMGMYRSSPQNFTEGQGERLVSSRWTDHTYVCEALCYRQCKTARFGA